MIEDDDYRKFVQSVIDNIKKNGFPEKKVAFGLEKMYEIAYNKGINFNKVLDTLGEIQIDHEKTPEKIIFFPKAHEEKTPPNPMDVFGSIDPSVFGNMNMPDMMQAASQMMQNLTPEQLEAVKKMYDDMSDEERAALIEKVKKMGGF